MTNNIALTLGIKEGRKYTVAEIAAITGRTKRTVFRWREYGFRSRRCGAVVLTLHCLRKGSLAWCWGEELARFLNQSFDAADFDRDLMAS